jgi:hypothetical protein
LAAEHQGEKTKKKIFIVFICYCWWFLNTGTGDKHEDSKECSETASGEVQTSSSDSRGLLLALNYALNYACLIQFSILL